MPPSKPHVNVDPDGGWGGAFGTLVVLVVAVGVSTRPMPSALVAVGLVVDIRGSAGEDPLAEVEDLGGDEPAELILEAVVELIAAGMGRRGEETREDEGCQEGEPASAARASRGVGCCLPHRDSPFGPHQATVVWEV